MISGMISAVSISVCVMEISKSMARLWARIRRAPVKVRITIMDYDRIRQQYLLKNKSQ